MLVSWNAGSWINSANFLSNEIVKDTKDIYIVSKLLKVI